MNGSALPVASTRDTARASLRLLGRHRMSLLGTVLILLAGVSAGLATPALLGAMVDTVARGQSTALGPLGLALLAATATSAALTWWGRILLAKLAQGALTDLRVRVFTAATAQPAAIIERAGTGDLVSRVSGDVEAVNTAIGRVLPAFVSALFTIALTLVGIGLLDWRLVLAVLLAAPVQYGALRWFLSRSGPVYRESRAAEARRGQQLIETLSGADTVAALRHGDRHLAAVARTSEEAIGVDLTTVRLRTIFFGRLNLAELIGLASVLGAAYWLVTRGEVTLGAATAAALYFHNLFAPIGVLLSSVDELQSAAAGLARLFGVTALESGAEVRPERDRSHGCVSAEMDAVSYSYTPGRPALHEVSLKLGAGERVAVVGASGAGKSTLAKLITGIHQPDSGTVRVDGTPLADLSPAALRARVGLLSQEIHVFTGTLAEDLWLFAPEATVARIEEILDRLDASWVRALPLGLDTVVGAGGHPLTAAQAHHLALARLVLADPPLAVLDEATAEAGTTDAAVLDAAAEAALAGRTAVVIAHRLSQARHADRILVLDGGRVVEEGTHEQLLEQGGQYARLWAASDG
ncbi:ABC transporter ATP-binding protein [Nonomuraea sp. NPDC046570]|uniref:ABC transporter ATP-binding protein n=1 Tax=Nonomuraea sp. NPDC046570 TaxID=3155255 RepID=UPI0033FF2726